MNKGSLKVALPRQRDRHIAAIMPLSSPCKIRMNITVQSFSLAAFGLILACILMLITES